MSVLFCATVVVVYAMRTAYIIALMYLWVSPWCWCIMKNNEFAVHGADPGSDN